MSATLVYITLAATLLASTATDQANAAPQPQQLISFRRGANRVLRLGGSVTMTRTTRPIPPDENDPFGVPYFEFMSYESLSRREIRRRHRNDSLWIHTIDLSHCDVSDDDLAFLASFPKVEKLILSNTRITDQGLEHIRYCKSLTHLQISDTQITKAGYMRFRKRYPELRFYSDEFLDEYHTFLFEQLGEVESPGVRVIQLEVVDTFQGFPGPPPQMPSEWAPFGEVQQMIEDIENSGTPGYAPEDLGLELIIDP